MHYQTGVLVLIFLMLSLVVGAATRYFLRRTFIPYSVALLFIGLIFGILEREHLFSGSLQIFEDSFKIVAEIDPHMILFIFIPALIFESAFNMEVHLFKRTLSQTAMLAVPGLIISTALTACFAKFVFPWGWSWPASLMFGALISATDPVAVVALLKELSSRKRLATLIEGESLLNDGTAIVFFGLFYTMLVGGVSGSIVSIFGTAAGQFVWVVALGVVIGLGLGVLALAWISKVFNDPLFEITISIAVAYLAYIIAEAGFHVSGIVAVVAVALMFAGRGQTMISPEVKEFLHKFWELLGYLVNTLIFLWAGVVIADRVELTDPKIWMNLALLYVALQVIRAISISTMKPLIERMGIGFSKNKAITLTWGGLRGAIALALALAVSQDDKIASELGAQILFLSAGIVVLSIFVNGVSMRWVLRFCGYDSLPPEKQAVVARAKKQIAVDVEELIPKLEGSQFLRQVDWANAVKETQFTSEFIDETAVEEKDLALAFRRRLLETERKDYWNQFNQGLLSAPTVKLLVTSVENALDQFPSLHPRPSLNKAFHLRPFIMKFRTWPLVGRIAERIGFNRLSYSYEVARGFMRAQVHVMSLAPKLAPDTDVERVVRKEIILNKREALIGIEELRDIYPEMISSLETRVAKRILLNQERVTIHELIESGVLDEAEAEKLIEEVEHKMQKLAHKYYAAKVARPSLNRTLRQIKWLEGVSDATLSKLVMQVEEKQFRSHEVIMKEGDTDRSMALITKGTVLVAKESPAGVEMIDIFGPGNVVGEMALLTGEARTATVKAEMDTTVLWISAEKLEPLFQEDPSLKAAINRVMEERLRKE